MHIILKDFKGSPDGFTVNEYKAGQELELPESLIQVAESEKWAKPAQPDQNAKKKAAKPAQPDQNATQKAELEAQIAQLEADLSAAEDAVKPAIQESLAAAKASLANLG